MMASESRNAPQLVGLFDFGGFVWHIALVDDASVVVTGNVADPSD
jgi:hypothetical protein